MLELKLTICAIFVGTIAMMTPNEQAQILCASIIGAGLCGYMGSYYFQGKAASGQLTFRKRWAANLATGSTAGPFLTDWLQPRVPDIPPIHLALASGGAVGGFGVLTLTIAVPLLLKWIPGRISPPQNPPD